MPRQFLLAAFNSAESQYDEEERAFRAAWSAVKRDYETVTGTAEKLAELPRPSYFTYQ